MQFLSYCLALPWIYFLSIIPFPVMYLFSDVLYFFVYYVFRYRKKVVFTNLRNAFPAKTEEEIITLHKRHYHWFCDMILESFKTLTISRETLLKHCSMTPEAVEIFNAYHAKKRPVIAVMGHFGIWEWAGHCFTLSCKADLYVIYQPLLNKHFDQLVQKMRSRFGARLVNMHNINRHMFSLNHSPASVTTFLGDQSPQPERSYWMQFLNQETGVFPGTERFACKLNAPVVYVVVKRQRRGKYLVDAEVLFDQPALQAAGEITEAHTQRLERDINDQPETWLWSHRRWKYKRPANVKQRSFSFTPR